MSEYNPSANNTLKKFVKGLDDIVQCPVCFEEPKGHITVCVAGHHICIECKSRTKVCVSCSKSWGEGTRDFVAENVREKLNEVKEAMLQANVDVATLKRCRIESCPVSLGADGMLLHLMTKHVQNLIQWAREKDNSYFVLLKLSYRKGTQYDFAGVVPDMGIIFINVLIHPEGEIGIVLKSLCKPPKIFYVARVELPRVQPVREMIDQIETYTANEELFKGAFKFPREYSTNMQDGENFFVKMFISSPIN